MASTVLENPANPFGILVWLGRSLLRHWDLVWQMAATDLRGRYVGSSLGLFWSVLHPLVMITIYTVVFSQVMGARLPGTSDAYAYGIYLCSALLPWGAFGEVISRSTTIFVDNSNLVRKVSFPKVVLYGFVMVSASLNLALALSVFVVALLLSGHGLPPTMLLWIPLIGLQMLLALGIGMMLSVVHVFVRDTAQLVAVSLQLLFWVTPIVYVEEILPERVQRLEWMNPLYGLSTAHHDLVLRGTLPDPTRVILPCVLAVAALIGGTILYRRFRADILDEI